MSRVPNAGPGQFMSNLGAGLTNQPFVQPANTYSVFDSIINTLPQVMGVAGAVADLDRQAKTQDYIQREAQAKLDAAKADDPYILSRFYEENQNNQVPAVSTAAKTAAAEVYGQINARMEEAEIGQFNLDVANVRNSLQVNGNYDEAIQSVEMLKRKYPKVQMQDAIVNLHTSITARQQEIEQQELIRERSRLEAANKHAKDLGEGVVASVLDDAEKKPEQFKNFDPLTTRDLLYKQAGNLYTMLAQTGEDTLGEDGLPLDPMVRAAIIEKFALKSGALFSKVDDVRKDEARNTYVTSFMDAAEQDPSSIPKRMEEMLSSGLWDASTESQQHLTKTLTNGIQNLSTKVLAGDMDPIKALRIAYQVASTATRKGIALDAIPGTTVNNIRAAISQRLDTNINTALSKFSAGSGMTPNAALALQDENGVTFLDHQILMMAEQSEAFDYNSILSIMAGADTLDGLVPKDLAGQAYKNELMKFRERRIADFPKVEKVRNPWPIVMAGGSPSPEDLKNAEPLTAMLRDNPQELYKLTGRPDVLEFGTMPNQDKFKMALEFAAIERRAAPRPPEHFAKSAVENLKSKDPTTFIIGLAQARMYGGQHSAWLKDTVKDNTEMVGLLTKMVLVGKYIDKDGNFIAKDGVDPFASLQRDVNIQVQGTKVFSTYGDLEMYEDAYVDPDLQNALLATANILTQRNLSKDEIKDLMPVLLKNAGYSYDETENRVIADPNDWVRPAKENTYNIQAMLQAPVMDIYKDQIYPMLGVDPAKHNIPPKATWWDLFKIGQNLPPDTNMNDYEFKVVHDEFSMQMQPVVAASDEFDPRTVLAVGGQIQYRLKDKSYQPSPLIRSIAGNPLAGVGAGFMMAAEYITTPDNPWRGAIQINGDPVRFNHKINNVPWKWHSPADTSLKLGSFHTGLPF